MNQVLGLYPLTLLPVDYGVFRYQEETRATFARPLATLPVRGTSPLRGLPPVAPPLSISPRSLAIPWGFPNRIPHSWRRCSRTMRRFGRSIQPARPTNRRAILAGGWDTDGRSCRAGGLSLCFVCPLAGRTAVAIELSDLVRRPTQARRVRSSRWAAGRVVVAGDAGPRRPPATV